MKKYYESPSGRIYTLFKNCLEQSHLLIAGATGCGKSVFENGLIATALYKTPGEVGFILIDPKMTELCMYRNLPHTIAYACEGKAMIQALQHAVELIMVRFKDAQRRGIREYDGSDIYVVVDELQDLMTTHKREAFPLLQRIAQIGRAAHVHLIACTQSPIREVIPTALKCNFSSRIALRTISKQDSRNIIEMTGCEQLPDPSTEHVAYGYYRHGANTDLYKLPYVSDSEIRSLIHHWMNQKPKYRLFA